MTLAMSGATRSDSGLASGLVNTTLQVGGALGLAVLATLSTTRTDTLLAGGESSASALTSGYHLAFVIATMLVVVAIGVAATVLQSRVQTAEEAEAEAELAGSGAGLFGGCVAARAERGDVERHRRGRRRQGGRRRARG